MWKEMITLKDFDSMASLRSEYGCAANIGGQLYMNNVKRKVDCHYYYYTSDTIKLLKGYAQYGDVIKIITFTIKAEVKDYPEALRLMAEHAKQYLKERKIKTLVIEYGYEDEDQMNNANVGVGKIGFSEFMKIVIEEYRKFGFKTTFDKKQVKNVLV